MERAIQKIKNVRMLSGVMDLKFKPLANQIVSLRFLCNLEKSELIICVMCGTCISIVVNYDNGVIFT